jgi:hypothetical protein
MNSKAQKYIIFRYRHFFDNYFVIFILKKGTNPWPGNRPVVFILKYDGFDLIFSLIIFINVISYHYRIVVRFDNLFSFGSSTNCLWEKGSVRHLKLNIWNRSSILYISIFDRFNF